MYDGQSRLVSTALPELNCVEYDYDDATCAAQQRCAYNVKAMRQMANLGSGQPTLTSSFTRESAVNYVNYATDPLGNVMDVTYTAHGDRADGGPARRRRGYAPDDHLYIRGSRLRLIRRSTCRPA